MSSSVSKSERRTCELVEIGLNRMSVVKGTRRREILYIGNDKGIRQEMSRDIWQPIIASVFSPN